MIILLAYLVFLCIMHSSNDRKTKYDHSDAYSEMPWKKARKLDTPTAKHAENNEVTTSTHEGKDKFKHIAIACDQMDNLHQVLKELNRSNFDDKLKDINNLVIDLLAWQNRIMYQAPDNVSETVEIIKTLCIEDKVSFKMKQELWRTLRLFDDANVLVLEASWAFERGRDEFMEMMQFVLDEKMGRETFKETMENHSMPALINEKFIEAVNALFPVYDIEINQMVHQLADDTFNENIGQRIGELVKKMLKHDADAYQANMCNLVDIIKYSRMRDKLSPHKRHELMKILTIEPMQKIVLEAIWDLREIGVLGLRRTLRRLKLAGLIEAFIDVLLSEKLRMYVIDKASLEEFDLVVVNIMECWDRRSEFV